MTLSAFRKPILAIAAALTAFAGASPALASGYVHVGYSGGYGHGVYHAGYPKYYGGHRRYHRRHYHRRGHGGGKGAAIALGVIGGAILLSEVARAEERRRIAEERRYYRDRYYRDRYDRYERRRYDDRDWGSSGDYGEDTSTPVEPRDRDIDDQLEGGPEGQSTRSVDRNERRNDGGPEPIVISDRRAYQTCTDHARRALSNRGFILAAPARPETSEDMGRAFRITATVRAQNNRGESWRRAMVCEADEDRVFLLELI